MDPKYPDGYRDRDASDATQPLRSHIAAARERLYRVALAWCGDAMLADDLVQDTLTIGLRNRDQLRDETRLFAWLYGILNHTWHRHLRRRRPQTTLDEQLESEASGPMACCQEQELVARVRRAVASLPTEQRQVIALIDLDELSYAQVAHALDIPIGTVMSRLHRARKNLLTRFETAGTRQTANQDKLRVVT